MLAVDGCLDLWNRLPLLVHGIRLQRNVLAHVSPERVPVHVTIEVILMAVGLEAPAVAGHPFDEFRDFFRNLVGPRRLACKQSWRERLRARASRDRGEDAIARSRCVYW